MRARSGCARALAIRASEVSPGRTSVAVSGWGCRNGGHGRARRYAHLPENSGCATPSAGTSWPRPSISSAACAPGISRASASPCAGGKQRIGGAVDDERRRRDLGEPCPFDVAAVDDEVVVRAGHRARAVVRAADDLPQLVLVDPARARVRSFGFEQERDRRVAVGPVRLVAPSLNTARIASDIGGSSEPPVPIGLVHISVRLRSRSGWSTAIRCAMRAAHRHADDVRALDAEPRRGRDRIGDQVVARVARPPGRVRRRAARVAMVVADDEAPVLREPLAEARAPSDPSRRPRP